MDNGLPKTTKTSNKINVHSLYRWINQLKYEILVKHLLYSGAVIGRNYTES